MTVRFDMGHLHCTSTDSISMFMWCGRSMIRKVHAVMITLSNLYHRREESQAEVSIIVQDEVTELLKDEVTLHCFFVLGYAIIGIFKIQPRPGPLISWSTTPVSSKYSRTVRIPLFWTWLSRSRSSSFGSLCGA